MCMWVLGKTTCQMAKTEVKANDVCIELTVSNLFSFERFDCKRNRFMPRGIKRSATIMRFSSDTRFISVINCFSSRKTFLSLILSFFLFLAIQNVAFSILSWSIRAWSMHAYSSFEFYGSMLTSYMSRGRYNVIFHFCIRSHGFIAFPSYVHSRASRCNNSSFLRRIFYRSQVQRFFIFHFVHVIQCFS